MDAITGGMLITAMLVPAICGGGGWFARGVASGESEGRHKAEMTLKDKELADARKQVEHRDKIISEMEAREKQLKAEYEAQLKAHAEREAILRDNPNADPDDIARRLLRAAAGDSGQGSTASTTA